MSLKIVSKKFHDLSLMELYQIMKIRSEVFLIEQNIKETDFDDTDFTAIHHYIEVNGSIIAYARSYMEKEYVKMGRLLVVASMRHKGYASKIISHIMDYFEILGVSKIVISAQYQVRALYQILGFKEIGETYMEADILHIKMIYEK